jgi:hypothetical protein
MRKNIIGAILDIPGRGQCNVFVLGESIRPHHEDPDSITLKCINKTGLKGMFAATLPERSFGEPITLPKSQLYFYPAGLDSNGVDHRKCTAIFGLMHKADSHAIKLLKAALHKHSKRVNELMQKIAHKDEQIRQLQEEGTDKLMDSLVKGK